MQAALDLIEDAERASAVLDPVRGRILAHLREPDSAAGVARALDLPRQRVGYHVRELERRGLLRQVAERRKGNFVERLLEATAVRYLIAPQALGPLAEGADEARDRFSSSYLITAAARTLRDAAELRARADARGKRLPTLTLETEVRFATPADQAAFAEEAAALLSELAARYHDEEAESGRRFRFALLGHPAPPARDAAPEGERG